MIVIMEGPKISGMCVNDDRNHIFFADPFNSRIIRLEYNDNSSFPGNFNYIYDENHETSFVLGVGCETELSHQIFWFNAVENTTSGFTQTYLYRGLQNGLRDPKEFLSDVPFPSGIFYNWFE